MCLVTDAGTIRRIFYKEDRMSDILLFFKDNSVPITAFTAILGAVLGSGITFWFSRQNYKLAKEKLEKENAITQAKIEADKKALRQQMITNNIAPMRQAWINNLRDKAGEYIVKANYAIGFEKFIKNSPMKQSDSKKYDLLYDNYLNRILKTDSLYILIKLLLPFDNNSNNEELADKVSLTLNEVNDFLGKEAPTTEEINNAEENLNKLADELKILLKQEWMVTKSLKEIE